MGPTALLPLRRKWCSVFLSPLTIHRPRSGSHPRTLGPVSSTITTRPPRSTQLIISVPNVARKLYVRVYCSYGHAHIFYLYSDLKCVTCCQCTSVQKTPQNPNSVWRPCHNAKKSFAPDYVLSVQPVIVCSRPLRQNTNYSRTRL
jgi:hypothetical protein